MPTHAGSESLGVSAQPIAPEAEARAESSKSRARCALDSKSLEQAGR